jgi:hypothetical protein
MKIKENDKKYIHISIIESNELNTKTLIKKRVIDQFIDNDTMIVLKTTIIMNVGKQLEILKIILK